MGGFIAGDELGGGGDGGCAVGGGRGVAAVVEDDVGGEALAIEMVDFGLQAEGDGVGGGIFPVGGHGIPEDRSEAEAAGDAEGGGAARAIRRTEEARGRAGDFGDGLIGAGELVFDGGGGGQGEVEMGPGMVADGMAGGGDLADEAGISLGAAANEEECGADIAAGEKLEEARGPGGVGAVVEGEGELAGARRGDERGAEELRGGPAGGVGEAAGSQTEPGRCAEASVEFHGDRGNHCAFQCAIRGCGRAREIGGAKGKKLNFKRNSLKHLSGAKAKS